MLAGIAKLLEGLANVEDLSFYLRVQLVEGLPVELSFLVLLGIKWVCSKNLLEGSRAQLWNELLASKAVVVAHVLVESSSVAEERLVLISSDLGLVVYNGFLKLIKVLVLEKAVEQHEKRWGLVTFLEWHDLRACPTCSEEVEGVVLLLLSQQGVGTSAIGPRYVGLAVDVPFKVGHGLDKVVLKPN